MTEGRKRLNWRRSEGVAKPVADPWPVLVVDDDPQVHDMSGRL